MYITHWVVRSTPQPSEHVPRFWFIAFMVAIASSSLAVARVARAAGAALAEPIRLDITVPADCGTRASFFTLVDEQARVRLAEPDEVSAARLFRVSIEAAAEGAFAGTLIIIGSDGAFAPFRSCSHVPRGI